MPNAPGNSETLPRYLEEPAWAAHIHLSSLYGVTSCSAPTLNVERLMTLNLAIMSESNDGHILSRGTDGDIVDIIPRAKRFFRQH
jgi:hypothetical protein